MKYGTKGIEGRLGASRRSAARNGGHILHKLEDIIIIGLCTVVCGGEDFPDLESLNIENSIVTADAMSCQKEIVRKIRKGGADYVICLKGNQPAMLEDISLYFEHFSGGLPNFVTKVKDHGRIEKRDYRLLTDLSWLTQQTEWSGLQTVGMVTATISRNDETTTDTRYFLSFCYRCGALCLCGTQALGYRKPAPLVSGRHF